MAATRRVSPDPKERCGKCGVQFGYDAAWDRIVLCFGCDEIMHGDCDEAHTCPGEVQVDQQKLRAWAGAAKGWA